MNAGQGTIFDIKRYSINDGPGIRTTIFFKGCPLNCIWCHNPESRSQSPQPASNKDIIGKLMSESELLKEIEKDQIFYDQSGGGVTFSGGEPLLQFNFLTSILSECNKKGIHTAVDTSGYLSPTLFRQIAPKADLFLYDLKLLDNDSHNHYTGVPNHIILENIKTLSELKIQTTLRFPVIPTITDSDENIKRIGIFASSLENIHEINIIPYHRNAEAKYIRLKLEYNLRGIVPPSDDHLNHIKKLFQQYAGRNMTVKII